MLDFLANIIIHLKIQDDVKLKKSQEKFYAKNFVLLKIRAQRITN